ncbi:MAG: RICIN domain-containing protein [Candidatus Thiodiazotropha sp.]
MFNGNETLALNKEVMFMQIETRQHTVKASEGKVETAPLITVVCFLLVALLLLIAPPTNAASLQLVPGSQWGSAGLNTTVEMKIYVPDNVVANPPVLVALHQCGGTGPFFFYDSQSNVSADQYGFIVIVPSTQDPDGTFGRCWDNGSRESLTRYGRADSEAVIRMVKYTLDTYHANPNRVYALGGSSGAMMVETMLGVYPEVFKAGVGFAGVTCGADGWWDGRNLIPQQWGDIVRAISPGYSGPYPRIQLWHGTADPIVSYKNLGNSAKQYSNLLGLNETPTSTTDEHLLDVQNTFIHQVWQNTCGDTLIDAYSEVGGGHGSDAWKPVFWVPFLGLDVVGPDDPIMPCDGDCNPTAITPYVQVKGDSWQKSASVTVTSGDQVTFGPQPVSSGAWSWSGCGTSGSSREQTISPTGSCTATATYTNSCGTQSTQDFTVNVNQDSTPNPPPSALAIENGRYNIVSSLSGLYLDVYGARMDDGTNVIQYPNNGGTNQQFDIEALGDGTYSIRAAHSGKAVEVAQGNANDGAELRQGTYTGGQNQRWRIDDVGDGVYSITSALSDKVIDVWEMNTSMGGEVKLYGWWGGSNQRWSFVKVR